MLLFVEISSIFVSARAIMFYHGMHGGMIYNLNIIITFITFFFGRVVYSIFITVYRGLPWWYDDVTKDKVDRLELFVLM